MPPRRLHRSLLAAALALSGLVQAASLPELGDASEAALPHARERALGEETMKSLRSAGAALDDPEIDAYLDSLGRRLLQADPSLAGQPFRFFAVDSAELNAFALPGGYVGVNTGLILATQSESELASVLAHEISHVGQHHIARQLAAQSGAQVMSLAALAAAIVAAGTGNGQAAMAAVTGATAAQAQSQINYTREHEQEADRLGFRLLVDAGFDPRAMAAFFERLQRATRLADSGATPAWLRTHPLTHERVAEAEDRAFARPYRQVTDSPEYHLARALVRSYAGTPHEAVARFAGELADGRYRDRNATRYGLAAAQLRAGDYAAAGASIAQLERDGLRHPMLEALAGQVLMQSGQLDAAQSRYDAALRRYPDYLQLLYDYPRLRLKRGDAAGAARFAEAALERHPADRALHQSAAEAWAALGNPFKSHYHQGELYALDGNPRAAEEQLELALKAVRDTATFDSPDYQLAEARLKTLRDARQAEKPAPRGGRPSQPGLALYPHLPADNAH